MTLNSMSNQLQATRISLITRYIVWLCAILLTTSITPLAAIGQPLQGGTGTTTIQAGTESTTLQGGTEGTLIEGGTTGTLLQGGTKREGGPVTILFLVDASLSMKEKLGKDNQKMDEAKRVLQQALARIPTDVNLALRVFGQFVGGGLECQATALLVPPGANNRRTIISKLRDIHPTGMTPLTYAIANAAERDLARVQGKKTIILITDGDDTCGSDPCAYVQTLPRRGINLKVDVLGLDMRDRSAKSRLDCIAKSSGGKYYDAETGAQLVDSVSHSVSAAISGTVLTPGAGPAKNILNPASPEELTPIVPAGSLEETLREDTGDDDGAAGAEGAGAGGEGAATGVKKAPAKGTSGAPPVAPPRKKRKVVAPAKP
jgi:hypothetical protein